jgi:hypothetical protein
VTAAATAVPIPRARPAEEEAPAVSSAQQPDYGRHPIE